MTFEEMKEYIGNITSHVTFQYDGRDCGVDPFSANNFDMWYGNETMTATSIDEVFTTPFFGGKCLNDIADNIENVE